MKEKGKNKKIIIIISIVLGILLYLLPIGLIFFVTFNEFDYTEFKEVDDKIIVENGEVSIDKVNSFYDKKNEYYVTEGYIKSNNDYLSYIALTFELYDKDDNIIGTSFIEMTDLEKIKKYKFKAFYNDYDANEITKSKLLKIYFY